jgi:para-aminobenzoate synthetase component 2
MPRISHRLGVVRVDVRADEVPCSDVVLLDSRDSFTFNLAQCCAELGVDVTVVDADDPSVVGMVEICRRGRGPALVMIGPGPRGPQDLPRLQSIVAALDGVVPLFGVCLGLQVLVTARGGVVGRARAPVHGKRDAIVHDGVGCLSGLPSPLWVMRYHSLVATSVPSSFTVTARDAFGQPMALRDVDARVEAVQFHPESIGTAGGLHVLCSALIGAGLDVRLPPTRPGSVPDPSSRGPRFSDAPTSYGPLTERQDTP